MGVFRSGVGGDEAMEQLKNDGLFFTHPSFARVSMMLVVAATQPSIMNIIIILAGVSEALMEK